MYEFEEFEYEFSKIYKRLLRLELLIKIKIKECALSEYKENVMDVFCKFFNNYKIYNKYKNDTINKNYFIEIRDNKDIPAPLKFTTLINMLTLRHLLHFIFTEIAFRIPNISTKFYNKQNIDFPKLKKCKTLLINLRNYIAHFDYKKFQKSKNDYLNALLLYEISLGCSLGKYNSIPNSLGYKPTTNKIIQTIYELAPELFKKNIPHSVFPYNKDRMIVDMFEDIAILNGYDYSELKSQWEIIREKYRFNHKLAEQGTKNLETDIEATQYRQMSISWNNIQ